MTSDRPGWGAGSGQPHRHVADSSTWVARGDSHPSACQRCRVELGGSKRSSGGRPLSGGRLPPLPLAATPSLGPQWKRGQGLGQAQTLLMGGSARHSEKQGGCMPGPSAGSQPSLRGDTRRGLWGAAQPRPLTLHPRFCEKKISTLGQAGRAELTPASFYSSGAKPPTTLPSQGPGPCLHGSCLCQTWGLGTTPSNKQSCMTVRCLSEMSHIMRVHQVGKATKGESQPPPCIEPSAGRLWVTRGGHCELCNCLGDEPRRLKDIFIKLD